MRVQAFTESEGVRALAVMAPYAYAVGDVGLERWGLDDGSYVHLGDESGVLGDAVTGLVADPRRAHLWIATASGVTRFEPTSQSSVQVPPAPADLGVGALADASLAPAGDGGVWLGVGTGLYHATPDGVWKKGGIDSPVRALLRTADGNLWVGTDHGLLVRSITGEITEFDATRGCDIEKVRLIATDPAGGPLVVGENRSGQQRVAMVSDGRCATYRVSPSEKFVLAVSRDDETLIMTPQRLYQLSEKSSKRRRLMRDGTRLLPAAPPGQDQPPASPFELNTALKSLPPGPVALAAAADEVLIGTRHLGTVRVFHGGKRSGSQWLRRSRLVHGARNLSVGCLARNDCFVATGNHVWHYDGTGFAAAPVADYDILVIDSDPEGALYAVARGSNPNVLILLRYGDGGWSELPGVELGVEEGPALITFARFAPTGLLWVGLAYDDGLDEPRERGVALVDVSIGQVAYHHASRDTGDEARGVLPVPINVVDAAFAGQEDVWFATSQGAAQVHENKVVVHGEADGLRSELLRSIACSPSGMVYVASRQGVGSFDGAAWAYPRELEFPVNDIAIDLQGRLWMATERGVASYDGARVRRLDSRRGLIENRVHDLRIDRFDRLWLRGDHSLSIIVP